MSSPTPTTPGPPRALAEPQSTRDHSRVESRRHLGSRRRRARRSPHSRSRRSLRRSPRPSVSICPSTPNTAERSASKPVSTRGDHVRGSGAAAPIIDELADRLEAEHGIAPRRGRDRRNHALPRRRPHRGAAQPVARQHVRRGVAGGWKPGLSSRQLRKTGPAVGHNTSSEGRPAQGRPPTSVRDRATGSPGECAVRIVLQPSRGSRRSCCQSPIGG